MSIVLNLHFFGGRGASAGGTAGGSASAAESKPTVGGKSDGVKQVMALGQKVNTRMVGFDTVQAQIDGDPAIATREYTFSKWEGYGKTRYYINEPSENISRQKKGYIEGGKFSENRRGDYNAHVLAAVETFLKNNR